MAQTFPTSPQIIYETLSGDAEFMSYVGEYKFKGNTNPIPALSVVTPGADLPSTRKVTGVEAVIQDAGAVSTTHYYNSSVQVTTWPIFLILWDPGTGTELQGATSRILQLFSHAEAIQVVATSDGLGAMVQNKVMIRSDRPILDR